MAPIYTLWRSSRSKQLRPRSHNTLAASLAARQYTEIPPCENSLGTEGGALCIFLANITSVLQNDYPGCNRDTWSL
ncbi:hypothetical protein ANTPLA_LOCUS8213 [Anthophora plagiata]